MKRIISILTVLGSFLLVASVAAQGGGVTVGGWAIGAGGGQSNGPQFTVAGISGQTAAAVSTGPMFTVAGGFWTVGNPGPASSAVHLPLILKQEPPTLWQRIGGGGLTLSSLALQGDQLFAAERRDFVQNGGLYQRSLAACGSTPALALVRIQTIAAPGYSIIFQGLQGVLATHKNDIFYSADGGNTWTQTATPVKDSRTVATTAPNIFYAGSNTAGIYRSTNGGVTWELRNPKPAEVSVLRLDTSDANILWVGTENAGVEVMSLSLDRLTPRNNGLTTPNSQKVWDFDFDSAGNIYVATYDGVFKWNNNISTWQPFGLQGEVQTRSLAVVGERLYAGAQFVKDQSTIAGVWRRPLTGGVWEKVVSPGWNPNSTVRDLLYDPTYCKGLLAATDDGLWLYR